jgi:predicted membrane channel-forming protein YqfA (hemolysin III family)
MPPALPLRNTRNYGEGIRPQEAYPWPMLYLVALGWMYVVLMVAAAEAVSPQGSLLGAFFTIVGWGVIPLAVVLYILATPSRRAARARKEASTAAAVDPHGSGHAAGDAVAPERKEG